jgi:hypothetical protein
VESGGDPTGSGRWTYITYDGEDGQRTTVISAYRVGNQHQLGVLTASQQQYRIQYQDESFISYILDPHRHTMIELEYFAKPLREKCQDIVLFINADEGIEHRFQPQGHKVAFKMDHGFQVDGKIDGSLRTLMENCGLVNIIAEKHGRGVPKTHIRGSKQIDFVCLMPRLAGFVVNCGLLEFDKLYKSDHRGIFIDIATKGVLGTPPEHLPPV